MLKRFLTFAAAAACGILLAAGVMRLQPAWSLWPNRELSRDTAFFRKVMQLVSQNYVHPKDASYNRLTQAALEGMVRSLDPHSEFLPAHAYTELREEMDGHFGGIGIQVERRNGKVIVIAPIADTPGERAGIQRGDEIVKVDGQSIIKLGMDKIIRRLRGRPGTRVDLTIYRPSEKKDINVAITREVIQVTSVRDAHMLGHGIGYIQIVEFSENTGREFRAALKRLEAQGLRALVLDLRNNPGGLLDQAVAVAQPFFKPGELVVYTQGRTPASRQNLRAGPTAGDLKVPIAVLVNSGTASAAEVVTGALHDTHRAVVVGERTFGKGSVQTVYRLKGGQALRLTTALYYTPDGISIQEKGITPQIPVPVSLEDEAKLRLQRLRRDLTNPKEFKERFGFAPISDRPLETAVAVLRGVDLYDARSRAPAAKP